MIFNLLFSRVYEVSEVKNKKRYYSILYLKIVYLLLDVHPDDVQLEAGDGGSGVAVDGNMDGPVHELGDVDPVITAGG